MAINSVSSNNPAPKNSGTFKHDKSKVKQNKDKVEASKGKDKSTKDEIVKSKVADKSKGEALKSHAVLGELHFPVRWNWDHFDEMHFLSKADPEAIEEWKNAKTPDDKEKIIKDYKKQHPRTFTSPESESDKKEPDHVPLQDSYRIPLQESAKIMDKTFQAPVIDPKLEKDFLEGK